MSKKDSKGYKFGDVSKGAINFIGSKVAKAPKRGRLEHHTACLQSRKEHPTRTALVVTQMAAVKTAVERSLSVLDDTDTHGWWFCHAVLLHAQ